MSEQVTVSKEFLDDLLARVETLETRLARKKSRRKARGKKRADRDDDDNKWADSLGDAVEKSSKETGRILKAMVDATAEAINETADAFSSLSEETDREKLGRIPAAVVSVMRRAIEIQRKTVNKFEASSAEQKEKEEDDD
ncbi:MAG: hypothetical protein GY859_38805 [Desulfobacterales bacterium]|nr:hypothetical protein [Desulfobacterales bacterium]